MRQLRIRGLLCLRLRTHNTIGRRGITSINFNDPSKIRNIALLAHIDSGKTTLTESILHATNYLKHAGSVDTGSTTTDFLPAERERGITIQSASIPVRWRDWSFNLVDTPGHADFGMEVESASRVIDGAVVLMDAVEGVEGQTLGVWKQLDKYRVPSRMIFLNKLDRPGASLRSSLKSIMNNHLHPHPVILTLPVSSFQDHDYAAGEPGIAGVVDLVNWKVWRWDAEGTGISEPLPRDQEGLESSSLFSPNHRLIPELVKAREALVDKISLLAPDFMDEFLSVDSANSPYLAVSDAVITSTLRNLTLTKEILPVVCGAAIRHVGTDVLLNFVGDLLASPADTANPKNLPVKSGEAQILAWKVGWDKQRGWMTFVRVYSGTLTRQSVLFNTASQQRERINKLVLLYADKLESVETLPVGSIGVILGLKHTRTGDTLVTTAWTDKSSHRSSTDSLPNITPPPAVISASVLPHSQSDVGPVKEALLSLSRTDPSLRISEDEEEGQTLVHGLGALHLEIVEGRLRDEWGVRCQFGKRRVSYRETLGSLASDGVIDVNERWEREVAGAKFAAEIELAVRSLGDTELASSSSDPSSVPSPQGSDAADGTSSPSHDIWGGNVVVSASGKRLPHPSELRPDSALLPLVTGLSSVLSSSPHTSLPLSHLHVGVKRIQVDEGAPPIVVTGAAAAALRKAVNEAGEGDVMEPYVRVKVDVGLESIGKVISDLTEHGGEIMDLDSSSIDELDEVQGSTLSEDSVYVPPAWITPSSVSLHDPYSMGSGSISAKKAVRAVAPLSQMLDYSTRLRALSGGLGSFEMSVDGFRRAPEVRKREILHELGH